MPMSARVTWTFLQFCGGQTVVTWDNSLRTNSQGTLTKKSWKNGKFSSCRLLTRRVWSWTFHAEKFKKLIEKDLLKKSFLLYFSEILESDGVWHGEQHIKKSESCTFDFFTMYFKWAHVSRYMYILHPWSFTLLITNYITSHILNSKCHEWRARAPAIWISNLLNFSYMCIF